MRKFLLVFAIIFSLSQFLAPQDSSGFAAQNDVQGYTAQNDVQGYAAQNDAQGYATQNDVQARSNQQKRQTTQTEDLWNKVQKNIDADLPQQAVATLSQLEKIATEKCDTLELYQIFLVKAECLSKYNWKEYNNLIPQKRELRARLVKDLDGSIAKYSKHQRLPLLLEEKIRRQYNKCEKDDENGYIAVRDDCQEVLAKYPSCLNKKYFEDLLSRLNEKRISLSGERKAYPGKSTHFSINTQNLQEIEYEVVNTLTGTIVCREKLSVENPKYYLESKTPLDLLFDEPSVYSITLKGKGAKTQTEYINVSRVAIMARERKGMVEVWACDALSGRGLSDVEITLENDGKVYERKVVSCSTGFVVVGKAKKWTTQVGASWQEDNFVKKESVYCSNTDSEDKEIETKHESHAVFTDRRLYHAGNDIEFKVIAYETNGSEANVLPGKEITVYLEELSDDKPQQKATLITNDFGSASGRFTLPSDAKLGRYRIYSGKYCGQSDVFFVAEYTPEKYSITVNKPHDVYTKEIFTAGNDIVVSGKITSYAGADCSGTTVRYTVIPTINGTEQQKISSHCLTDGHGNWEWRFTTLKESAYYRINISATTPEGETYKKEMMLRVSADPVRISENFASIQHSDDEFYVCREDVGEWIIEADNRNGQNVELAFTYTLCTREGQVAASGKGKTNKGFTPALKNLAPGYYTFKYAVNDRGISFEGEAKFCLISKKTPFKGLEKEYLCYVCPNGNDFILGTSGDEMNFIVEQLCETEILRQELITLSKTTKAFLWKLPKNDDQEIILNITAVKNLTEHQTFKTVKEKVGKNEMPLVLESFTDKTFAQTQQTITFKGAPESELLVSIYDIATDKYGANNFYLKPYYDLRQRIHYSKASSDAIPFSLVEQKPAFNFSDETPLFNSPVRSNSNETIAFLPHVVSDKKGRFHVTFTTGEHLSTFRILALAHNKKVQTGTCEGSFMVQKSIMVQGNMPLAANVGDTILLKAKVSNVTTSDVKGTARLVVESEDGIYSQELKSTEATVRASKSTTLYWQFVVPEGYEKLYISTIFASEKYSDGEKVTMRIYPRTKTLTESISWIKGDKNNSRAKAEKELTERLGQHNGTLTYREVSALDAVKEALGTIEKPEDENFISWINYYYVSAVRERFLGGKVSESDLQKTLSVVRNCQHENGGFTWFEGMNSSRLLTLFALEKFADLQDIGMLPKEFEPYIDQALAYIDDAIKIETKGADWKWAYITEELHAYLRFREHSITSEYIKRAKAKSISNISILRKAKHYEILKDRDVVAGRKVLKSLADYAVENSTVGYYFPNAVLYYRGLLRTELYAHCLLLNIFSSVENSPKSERIAAGLYKWILLQKHNQAWESNVATADAVNALLSYRHFCDAPNLTFASVLYTYTAPINEVKAFSNEMNVKVVYRNLKTQQILTEGSILHVGDKIAATYEVTNSENRSFVKMSVAHPVCLYPDNELSGGSFWGGYYKTTISGQTNYYFQVLFEEKTNFTEYFTIRYEGVFHSGVTTIESLYAPEYRANTTSKTWHVKN